MNTSISCMDRPCSSSPSSSLLPHASELQALLPCMQPCSAAHPLLCPQASVLVDAKAPSGATSASPRRGEGGRAAQGSVPSAGGEPSAEALWACYASRLSAIIVRHLRADYWHMPQARALSYAAQGSPRMCSRQGCHMVLFLSS